MKGISWWNGHGWLKTKSKLKDKDTFFVAWATGRLEFLWTEIEKSHLILKYIQRLQFRSVAQSCLTLWPKWTAAHQASLSITSSWSLLKRMSIESVMPYNHLILYCPLLLLPSIFPSVRVFSNESVLGSSASTKILPMNIQEWFPLWLTGLIS